MTTFGVSPAFVVSRHGTGFSIDNFHAALEEIHRLGFTAFQPEIFTSEAVPAWEQGATGLARHAADLGLRPSQFVAHFLLEEFASPARLSHDGRDALQRTLGCAQAFAPCRVFTVPLPPFQPGHVPVADQAFRRDLWSMLLAKTHAWLETVQAAGFDLAFEVLPFSLVSNADGFLRLAAEVNSPRLGVNLDTGHAWATRENMSLLPAKLAGRILGVHLKDNDSDRNQALAPGRGTIPWTPFLRGLRAAGYTGSWDLEIGCAPEHTAAEYTAGREFLRSLHMDPAGPPPDPEPAHFGARPPAAR